MAYKYECIANPLNINEIASVHGILIRCGWDISYVYIELYVYVHGIYPKSGW